MSHVGRASREELLGNELTFKTAIEATMPWHFQRSRICYVPMVVPESHFPTRSLALCHCSALLNPCGVGCASYFLYQEHCELKWNFCSQSDRIMSWTCEFSKDLWEADEAREALLKSSFQIRETRVCVCVSTSRSTGSRKTEPLDLNLTLETSKATPTVTLSPTRQHLLMLFK